jgi:hypothetical protein
MNNCNKLFLKRPLLNMLTHSRTLHDRKLPQVLKSKIINRGTIGYGSPRKADNDINYKSDCKSDCKNNDKLKKTNHWKKNQIDDKSEYDDEYFKQAEDYFNKKKN